MSPHRKCGKLVICRRTAQAQSGHSRGTVGAKSEYQLGHSENDTRLNFFEILTPGEERCKQLRDASVGYKPTKKILGRTERDLTM
jgi:hypothetical protein